MKKSPYFYLAGILLGLSFSLVSLYAEERKTVLVWGDSLSSAYGMSVEKGWVSLLEKRINGRGYKVINASLGGEITRGGLVRLPAMLTQHQPDIVILELGGNDGLRGISIQEMQNNLLQMTEQAQQSGAVVLLLGMQIPPNYGPVFSQQFSKAFTTVADKTGAAFVPFFLENVATDFDLIQADGIHPLAKAQPVLLNNIWPVLEGLL